MQVLVPIEEHAEMDFNIVEISKRLNKIPFYVDLSQKAYNRDADPYVITRSISLFERTLVSDDSKFDRYLKGKAKFSREELKGMNLFMNELSCVNCHSGFNFTNYTVQNTGLEPSKLDSGRMRVTKLEIDRDLFKVPTLRNIELTGPYMHDGRFESLEQVIEHYASGGINHPNKSELIKAFEISSSEKSSLIAFLKTLTDETFIENKSFSTPNQP